MKYKFSDSGISLAVETDIEGGIYTAQVLNYSNPSVGLANSQIYLYNYGMYINKYELVNIMTISGVAPTSIQDAYDKLVVLINSIAPSEGGEGGGGGDASGTITTQNLGGGGTATTGSAVEITLLGTSGLTIQTIGTYTGALSLQVTTNGINWITVGGTPFLNVNTGAFLATITSALQSGFQTEIGGFLKARITGLAAMTGSVVVTLKAIANSPIVAIDTPISIASSQTLATVSTVGSISTSVVPGVSATHLGKSEDAVAASGDTGIFMLGVRRDSALVSTSATGDYSEFAVDKFGATLTKEITRHKRTYSAAFNLFSVTTVTDLFQIIGSATTTISINKISFTAYQTTAAQLLFTVAKRSSVNTGGTSTAATLVSHDSTDSSATTVCSIYSAVPVSGSNVGNIRSCSMLVGPANAQNSSSYTFDFGSNSKPIVLNGVTQALVLNLGGATMTAGSVYISIEFTEE
jgi:hypothetical protein